MIHNNKAERSGLHLSVAWPFRLPRRRPCRRSSKNAGTNTGMAAWKAALPVLRRLVDLPLHLVYLFPYPFTFLRRQGVRQRRVPWRLPAQFAVALPPLAPQPPIAQRALHRAPRLAHVRAIAVAA